MKKKIAEALKTKYKSFGLSNEAWDRIASAKEETVKTEEEIADAISGVDTMDLIAKELVKMRDTEIQKRTDLQREHDDYKAKHPDDDPNKTDPPQPLTQEAIAKMIKDATSEAVKSVKDEFDAYKAQVSGKEAITVAKTKFYENKWTTKFKEEADDAWERAHELNEAKGGTMSQEDLTAKATEYFNKLVQRKGTDATKPFEEGGNDDKNFDFSDQKKHLQDKGVLPKDTQ